MIVVLMTWITFTRNSNAALDEKSFLQEFLKAAESKDKAKMEELVKHSEATAYKLIIRFAINGIKEIAEGKEVTSFFKGAGGIAIVYAKVFDKEGPLELIKKYKLFTQEMCREKLKGDDLIKKGGLSGFPKALSG